MAFEPRLDDPVAIENRRGPRGGRARTGRRLVADAHEPGGYNFRIPSPEKIALIAQINESVKASVPHNRELGLTLIDFKHRRGEATMRLPYSPRLAGDAESGVLHGGVITTLMDAACGMAVMIKLGVDAPIATVDLRIDYLKPATAQRDVIAQAHCYKVTRSIAFVRGFAYHDDPEDPIAAVAATFIRKAEP